MVHQTSEHLQQQRPLWPLLLLRKAMLIQGNIVHVTPQACILIPHHCSCLYVFVRRPLSSKVIILILHCHHQPLFSSHLISLYLILYHRISSYFILSHVISSYLILSHLRVVELPKTEEGLGFNVMGGKEQNSPIYISRIIPGAGMMMMMMIMRLTMIMMMIMAIRMTMGKILIVLGSMLW